MNNILKSTLNVKEYDNNSIKYKEIKYSKKIKEELFKLSFYTFTNQEIEEIFNSLIKESTETSIENLYHKLKFQSEENEYCFFYSSIEELKHWYSDTSWDCVNYEHIILATEIGLHEKISVVLTKDLKKDGDVYLYMIDICFPKNNIEYNRELNKSRVDYLIKINSEIVEILPQYLKRQIINDTKNTDLDRSIKISTVKYNEFKEKIQEYYEVDEQEYTTSKTSYSLDRIYGCYIKENEEIIFDRKNVSVIISNYFSYQRGEVGGLEKTLYIYIYNPKK